MEIAKKFKEDEREFLLNKYKSLGYSRNRAEKRVNWVMRMAVVSAVTMII